MSFPRYPHYKPSGVEWLGEVPEHWACPGGKQRTVGLLAVGWDANGPADVRNLTPDGSIVHNARTTFRRRPCAR